MERSFQKILTLIDYSDTSFHAAEESAFIASKLNSELHLLHISPDENSPGLLTPGLPFFESPEKEEEEYYTKVGHLEKIKKDLNRRYGVSIMCFESRGTFIDIVKRHVENYLIDLIVLGARKRNWLKEIFNESKANSVIRSVDCEVLCVQPQSKTDKLKQIVLPIGESVPRKKIGIAYELAKRFAAKIHLIALNKQEKVIDNKSTEALVASYQYLRDITNIPLECRTIAGRNLADAAVHYAEVIEADLILIDEGAESDLKKIAMWKGTIVNYSSIPVLSVQSISDKSGNRYRA